MSTSNGGGEAGLLEPSRLLKGTLPLGVAFKVLLKAFAMHLSTITNDFVSVLGQDQRRPARACRNTPLHPDLPFVLASQATQICTSYLRKDYSAMKSKVPRS